MALNQPSFAILRERVDQLTMGSSRRRCGPRNQLLCKSIVSQKQGHEWNSHTVTLNDPRLIVVLLKMNL